MPGICLSLWEHNVTDNADMMIIFRLLWLTSVSLFSLKELNENPYYKCCGACFLLFVRQKPCFIIISFIVCYIVFYNSSVKITSEFI